MLWWATQVWALSPSMMYSLRWVCHWHGRTWIRILPGAVRLWRGVVGAQILSPHHRSRWHRPDLVICAASSTAEKVPARKRKILHHWRGQTSGRSLGLRPSFHIHWALENPATVCYTDASCCPQLSYSSVVLPFRPPLHLTQVPDPWFPSDYLTSHRPWMSVASCWACHLE